MCILPARVSIADASPDERESIRELTQPFEPSLADLAWWALHSDESEPIDLDTWLNTAAPDPEPPSVSDDATDFLAVEWKGGAR